MGVASEEKDGSSDNSDDWGPQWRSQVVQLSRHSIGASGPDVAQSPPDMLDAKQRAEVLAGSSGTGELPREEEKSGTSRTTEAGHQLQGQPRLAARAGVGRKFKADAKKGKGYGTFKAHRHNRVSVEHRRCESDALAADVPLDQIKGAPANVPDEERPPWLGPATGAALAVYGQARRTDGKRQRPRWRPTHKKRLRLRLIELLAHDARGRPWTGPGEMHLGDICEALQVTPPLLLEACAQWVTTQGEPEFPVDGKRMRWAEGSFDHWVSTASTFRAASEEEEDRASADPYRVDEIGGLCAATEPPGGLPVSPISVSSDDTVKKETDGEADRDARTAWLSPRLASAHKGCLATRPRTSKAPPTGAQGGLPSAALDGARPVCSPVGQRSGAPEPAAVCVSEGPRVWSAGLWSLHPGRWPTSGPAPACPKEMGPGVLPALESIAEPMKPRPRNGAWPPPRTPSSIPAASRAKPWARNSTPSNQYSVDMHSGSRG